VAPLIQVLRRGDAAASTLATLALVKIGQPAVQPILAAYHTEDKSVQRVMAEILKQIGGSQAEETLITALSGSGVAASV
jgi:HEAT repeat protein